VRIRAGRYKGRVLAYPKSGLRPTKDITRQAVFNILGSRVKGARVLDLYAGGGALGIEALSRGATETVFVEQNPLVVRYLRENVKGLDGAVVVRGDVLRVLARLPKEPFDVVLADPPYRRGLVQATLDRAAECGLVASGGWFVVEHHRMEQPVAPDGWESVKQGRYGESLISILRRLGGQESTKHEVRSAK